MAQLNHDNPFQSWILSTQEFIQGSVLNILQKQVIQNQIAQLSQTKNALTFDTTNPQAFIQAEAELRGQITALQYLIHMSNESERQLDPALAQIHI